jgi:transcriptional regulator with XRE-family HTH domain
MSFSKSHRPSTVANAGVLLREWRAARRMSQLELALEAEVSARYLSCVETGKSQPSREMIARLADALAMPLRERNALLMAAGYAPGYPETALRAKELGQIHRAVELILKHQEPYPAFVLNRHWDVIRANPAAVRVGEFLIGGSAHRNMVRQFFDPNDLRRVVANWEEVAGDLIRHLHDALAAIPFDTKTRALLDDVLRYPGVPSQWRGRELTAPPPPILTVEFRKDNQVLRFFSTITTFGTSRDITIDELRIECTFPADDSTAERCRALAASA